MHACRGEVGVGLVGGVGVIGAWDDHGRGAVFEQVDFLCQRGIHAADVFQQVGQGPRHTVTFGLSRHDERVHVLEHVDVLRVALFERLAHGAGLHLGADGGVVLGEGMIALDLELGLRGAGDGMEEERLLHRRDQCMAHTAQHGVIWPDRQRILAAGFQLRHVMQQHFLPILGRDTQRTRQRRIELPLARAHILDRDLRVGGRVFPVGIHEEDGMEDLDRHVRIERGRDL